MEIIASEASWLPNGVNVKDIILRLLARPMEALAALHSALFFSLLLLAPPVDLPCNVTALEL